MRLKNLTPTDMDIIIKAKGNTETYAEFTVRAIIQPGQVQTLYDVLTADNISMEGDDDD